jgi:hypothetical protein
MDIGKLLSWIPGWLGFLALILVGLGMTINGAANSNLDAVNRLGFLDFGIMAIIVGTFSWIAGGTSKIKGREGTVGVKVAVQDMPWWGWLVDGVVVAVAIIIFVAAK